MATDTERQPILDELLATVRQLQQAGVPVGVKERDGVLWVGLKDCHLRGGVIVFDSTASLVGEGDRIP